jgi:AcrR family transcriptional regulator
MGGRPVKVTAQAHRSQKISPRWEAQHRELIAAARRAINKKGPRVSMDEIAEEAGVAKPILYRHFGDRAGLARAIGESMLFFSGFENREAILQRMASLYPTATTPEGLLGVLKGFIGQYSTFVEVDLDVYRFLQTEQAIQRLMQGPEGTQLRSPVIGPLTASLKAMLEERGLDTAPAEMWAHAITGLIGGAVEWWAEKTPFHRFELEKHVLDLAWRGIGGILESRRPQSVKRRAKTPRRAARPTRARGVRRVP